MIRWKGVQYTMSEPVVVEWPAVRSAFYPVEWMFVPLIGIEQFVYLRHDPQGSTLSQNELLDPLHMW
jgi:hypothetical protein